MNKSDRQTLLKSLHQVVMNTLHWRLQNPSGIFWEKQFQVTCKLKINSLTNINECLFQIAAHPVKVQ